LLIQTLFPAFSCTFSVEIFLLRHNVRRSTCENGKLFIAFIVCDVQRKRGSSFVLCLLACGFSTSLIHNSSSADERKMRSKKRRSIRREGLLMQRKIKIKDSKSFYYDSSTFKARENKKVEKNFILFFIS
jgi:hypothetical protein